MDETAEGGVAAHWRYKEGSPYDPKKEQVEIENQLHWFKDFVSMTDEDEKGQTAKDYVETLSHDIFDANVYIFTPKGNVICLPNGATPIDFAYRIHSDIGEHLVGAKVNNILVPISTPLKTGDIVEVITGKNASPNSEWLNIAKTNFARNKIRKYLVRQNADYIREDAIKKGRQALIDGLRERKLLIDPSKVVTKKVLDGLKCPGVDDLYILLASKTVAPSQVIELSENVTYSAKKTSAQLTEEINRKKAKKNVTDSVLLANGDTVMTNLANCCLPIPGDEIIGFVSTGQGVKVHRKECPNVKAADPSRLIAVKWNPDVPKAEFLVDLAVQCHDRDGLLMDVLNVLNNNQAKLFKVNAKYHPGTSTTTISVTMSVENRDSLDKYIQLLTGVKSVFQVDRLMH